MAQGNITTNRIARALLDRSVTIDFVLGGISFIALVLVLARAFAAPQSSGALVESTQPAIGEVTSRVEEVRRRHDGTLVWFDSQSGDVVHEADAFYVGGDSSATIALRGGAMLHLSARSLVVVRAPASGQKLDVEVLRGGAVGEAGEIPLSMRNEEAAVKIASGARARMSVHGEDTVVQVTRGEASLAGGQGGTQTMQAGQRAVVRAGEAEAPRSLFPTLEEPAPGNLHVRASLRQAVTFRWESKPGTLFRLEVAEDEGFVRGLRSYETPTPNLTVGDLPDGAFVWRVRAGEDTSEVRDLTIHTRLPPSLIEPRDTSVVDLSTGRPVVFSWTPVDGASKYRLEVARGRNFDAPVLTGETRRSSLVVAASKMSWDETTYCYRVAPVGMPVLVSSIQCFRLITRPVLRAPELFDPETEEDESTGEQGWNLLWKLVGGVAHAAPGAAPEPLTLRWESVPGATGYVLEIAADKKFSRTELREKVPESYFRWQPPAYARFFWRVRAVDDLGREGEVSSARAIDLRIPIPTPTRPNDGSFVALVGKPVGVSLEWGGSEELVSYELQISRDASFGAETQRIPSTKRTHAFSAGAVGTYHWRVIGRLSNGAASDPSRVSTFRVVVAAPSLSRQSRSLKFQGGEKNASLSWSARPVGEYEIQIAEDTRFSNPRSERLRQRTYTFELPDSGTVYWRVRGRSPSTAWSSVGKVEVGLQPPTGLAAEVLEGGKVHLSWEPTAGARAYRVRLAGSTSGEKTQQTDGTSMIVNVPGERYRWSVVALGRGDVVSRPSESGLFELENSAGLSTELSSDSEPSVVHGGRVALRVGPRLGFYSNVGSIVTARVGAEFDIAPSKQPQLSVALIAGYFTATESAMSGGSRASSRIHGIPVDAVVRYRVLAGKLHVEPAAGLSLTMLRTQLSLNGTSLGSGGKALIGAKLALSLVGDLGPGLLAGEVGYTVSSKQGGAVEVNPSGLTLTLGYRFSLLP